MGLTEVLDWIFHPLVAPFTPLWSVIILSFVITLFVTLAYKFFTDQKLLKSIKEEMKQLQGEVKKARDNPERMMQLNQEMMRKNAILLKSSFKPMVITLIPILIIFGWLRKTFGNNGDLLHIFGLSFGWLGTYIISSIIFSMVLRKVLKVH